MDMEIEDELTLSSRIINIIKEMQNLQDGPGANLTSIYNGLNGINEGKETIEGVTVTITTDVIQKELNQLVLNNLLLRFISSNSGQQSFEIPQSSNRILDLSQCGGDYEQYILVMSKCIEQVKKELSKQAVNESSTTDTDHNTPDYHEMTKYIRHSFYIKFDEVDKKVQGLDKWLFLENLVRDTVHRLGDSRKEEKLEKLVTKSNEMKEMKESEGIEETEEGSQKKVDSINKWVENTIDFNTGIRSKSKRLSEIAMKKDLSVVQPPPPKDCQIIAIKNFKELMSPKKKKAKRALYKIKNNMITYKGFKFENPTVSLTRLPLNVIGGHDHNHDVNLNDNSFFASTPPTPVSESPNFKAKNYKKQESILKFFTIESPTNKDKDKSKDQIKDNDKDLDDSSIDKSMEKSTDNKEDLQVDVVEKMDHQNVEIEKKEKGDSKKCQPQSPKPFETTAKNKGPKSLNEFSRKIVKKRFVKPSISKETTLSSAAIKNFRGRGPASRSNNKNAIKSSKSGTSTSMDQTPVNRGEIMISSEPELQEKEKTGMEFEINDQRANTIHNHNDNDNNADHSLKPSINCSAKEESFNLGELLLKDTCSFDYQIFVNDQAFKVHKNVLSCQSEYFAKLFKTKNHQQSLHISDLDPKAFNSILNFLYKGNFQPQDSLNLKSILEYLGFGIKYGIKRLETFCKIQILKAEK